MSLHNVFVLSKLSIAEGAVFNICFNVSHTVYIYIYIYIMSNSFRIAFRTSSYHNNSISFPPTSKQLSVATHTHHREPSHSSAPISFLTHFSGPALPTMPQQKKMENTKADRAKQAKQKEAQEERAAAKAAKKEEFKRRVQSTVHHCALKGKEKGNCAPISIPWLGRDICRKHEVYCRSCNLTHLKHQPCGGCGTPGPGF